MVDLGCGEARSHQSCLTLISIAGCVMICRGHRVPVMSPSHTVPDRRTQSRLIGHQIDLYWDLFLAAGLHGTFKSILDNLITYMHVTLVMPITVHTFSIIVEYIMCV